MWDSMLRMETKRHGVIVDDGKKRANWGELGVILKVSHEATFGKEERAGCDVGRDKTGRDKKSIE